MHDFIIVGAGSAGCVLANRLSANPTHKVLILEAGGDERRKEVSIPAAWPKLFKSACDWAYETEANPSMDGRRLFVPRGRLLGGSSSTNAMMYVRGHRADYDEWAALGNVGWGYRDVLPYFKLSEGNSRGASEYHGGSGPMAVSDLRDPNPLSLAFIEAAVAAGIPPNPDCNGAIQDGVGLVQSTTRNGRRWSSADAFLRPILGRPNLTVATNAHALQIICENRRAVGVKYLRNGHEEVAMADREVLVSSGALNSPQLLMLSGIGPASELRRHGIDVVHDLPGVGQNLQEHAGGKMVLRCSKPISLFAAESVFNVARYLLFRRGMLATNGGEAVAFVRTRPNLEAPDVELFLFPVMWLNEGLTPPPGHGFSIAVINLKPRSRGCVRLRSRDPLHAPIIDTNHLSDPNGEDLRNAVEGLRVARRIVAAEPLASMCAEEVLPGGGARTDAELAAAVRADGQTIYHPVGTCKMGLDAMSVVDPTLSVHGISNLRVVDASVMPSIIRGHTHAPAVMIAEKAAALLLA